MSYVHYTRRHLIKLRINHPISIILANFILLRKRKSRELVVDLVDVFEHLEVVLIDVLVTRVQVGHPLGELFNEPVRLVAVDLVQGYDLHAVGDAREVTECGLTRLSRLQFVPIQPNQTKLTCNSC